MMASAFPLTSTLPSNRSLQMPLRPSTTQPGTLSTPPPLPPPSHLLFLHKRDTQYLVHSRRHEASKPPDTARARTSLFRSLSSAPASAVSPTSGNTQPPSARSALPAPAASTSASASPSFAPRPSSSPPVSNNNALVTTTEHASPTHVSPSAPIAASGYPSASSFEPEHKPDRHISPHQHRTSSTTALTHTSARQSQDQQARQPDAQPAAHAPTTQATAGSRLQEPRGNQQKSPWSHGFVMSQKNRSTSSLLERRRSIMGARNLFSSSSSGPAEVDHLQRPRTSAGAAEASPTKSRFSRLRYRRNREKTEPDVAEPQQQRRQTTLEQLPEGAFLDFDDDAAEPESRPSTSSSVASSVKSSGGWSWSMRSRRSSGGLRERWRASSISSSSSSLSSASSYVSSSSSSTSSTWSSLESTPRASIASSRTSYSSDDEDIRPQKETPGTTRPTKTVRAYVCRHFVSIPIPEEEPEDIQNNQQSQQPQLPPTPSPDENEGCMTDPMADAFDLDAHLPPPHILRPWVEPTPPPTPPLQQKQLQPPSSPPTEHLSVPQSPPPAQGVPTFILTPASPIQPSSPSPFSSSPPSAATARRSFSAPVTSNPSTVPTTGLRRRSASNASSSRQKVEKGTPAHCPTCVRLQESMAHMRKVAGIYGPRHSLTVAAAKNARAARVAWAEAQWEASCADDGPDDAAVKSRKEGFTAEQGKKKKKSVSIQPGATFFVDREPFVQGPPSTSAGDDAEEEEAIDIETQLQREMIIGQRLWGPLGERGRKQREFKRSLSDSYVPGRWAVAAGNEWLDTSGRTQTYEEFWEGKTKGKDGGSVLLGGKVIRGVLGKMVPGAGHAKRERERAERLERGMGLDVD